MPTDPRTRDELLEALKTAACPPLLDSSLIPTAKAQVSQENLSEISLRFVRLAVASTPVARSPIPRGKEIYTTRGRSNMKGHAASIEPPIPRDL